MNSLSNLILGRRVPHYYCGFHFLYIVLGIVYIVLGIVESLNPCS